MQLDVSAVISIAVALASAGTTLVVVTGYLKGLEKDLERYREVHNLELKHLREELQTMCAEHSGWRKDTERRERALLEMMATLTRRLGATSSGGMGDTMVRASELGLEG